MSTSFNTDVRKINVTALFAGFKTPGAARRVTPLAFALESGESHRVAQIRRVYTDKVGDALHIHFVVRTGADRYFDLVYDSKDMTWRMVLEIEDALLFND